MKRSCSIAALGLAASLLVLGPPDHAAAQGGVEAGILTCQSVPGTKRNLIIRSTQDVTCVFETASGATQRYRGETGIALGIDFQLESNQTLAFTVLSGTADRSAPILSGRYVGAEASAELGVGATAAVLVGGGSNNVSLQPIALGVQAGGAGVAAGVGYLYLEPAR